MSHTWVRNPATGGVWACPVAVLAPYLARGWEPCDEPETDDSRLHDPQEFPATVPENPKPTNPRKAAKRGQTTAKEL